MDKNAICEEFQGNLSGKEVLTIVSKHLEKKIDETDNITVICCDCHDN